jgi:hypothetical protein
MVAIIVSAFLYYNLFELFFNPVSSGPGACGTMLRPVIDESGNLGWIWDSGISLFKMNGSLRCPRTIQGMGWEFFASCAGLAVCGLVLRRAIKRENAALSASGQSS